MRWHQKQINEVIEDLKSSLHGLSSEEARKRLAEYGPNELKQGKRKTALEMFFGQFRDFMIIVLMTAAVFAGLMGEAADTIAIIVIVILNAAMGFTQEYRAEKAMEALKMMAAPTATVLRDGHVSNTPSSDVVPGDAVVLEAGRVVPADLRIIESVQLKVEEAVITGESIPVEKATAPLYEETMPLGDMRNMAYKGTMVSYGRGRGIAVGTGMETELGRIASMLREEEEVKTPLQKRLAKFGQKLAVAILVICAIVFGIGVMRGEPPLLMLLTAVSLAVAAIPEALPAVVTISLALGARKMVKQNILIRKLPAVETLGSVTYICSDKTGTLTLNRMAVEEVYAGGGFVRSSEFAVLSEEKNLLIPDSTVSALFSAMALSSDAFVDAKGKVVGDPTEIAFYLAAEAAGLKKNEMEASYPRIAEIPFDSDRKMMTTIHKKPTGRSQWLGGRHGFISFTKGAIDVLLQKSVNTLTYDGFKPIDANEIIRTNERMAADGLRVLGIAMRQWDNLPADVSQENMEAGLTILGLVGIMDTPREEVKEAVALCKSAGIKPVMITGDHPITARAIAKRLGIIDDDGEVMTGVHLERLRMEEFEKKVEDIRVYARVAPAQKLKIIKALQDKGQFVAMTGDGINDAPALKRADIGIAMGITGTDVAKEAAHMILLNDNFVAIVAAVKEGRRIFDNIRKFIKYTMASNSGEIWTISLAPLLGLPIPLLPIHILWINLVTDGVPGLALAAEPSEKGVMSQPPRRPQESIFAHGLGIHIIWVGLLMGAVSLFTQTWAITTGHVRWQTMVFTVLCLSQMGHILAIRSEADSLFSQGVLSNKPLIAAFALTFVLQMATIYIPFLQPIFKTEALSANELIFTLFLSSIVFFAVEIEKICKRRTRLP